MSAPSVSALRITSCSREIQKSLVLLNKCVLSLILNGTIITSVRSRYAAPIST